MTRRFDPHMLARARALRANATPAERALWAHLRRKGIDGRRFRRQFPCGPYVLDFYCPAARLAVEIDGDLHADDDARRADEERTAHLARFGIEVIRFTNREVRQEERAVLERIWEVVRRRSPRG